MSGSKSWLLKSLSIFLLSKFCLENLTIHKILWGREYYKKYLHATHMRFFYQKRKTTLIESSNWMLTQNKNIPQFLHQNQIVKWKGRKTTLWNWIELWPYNMTTDFYHWRKQKHFGWNSFFFYWNETTTTSNPRTWPEALQPTESLANLCET